MPTGSEGTRPLPPTARRRGLSLGIKLPLFIGGLIALVIAVDTWGDYGNHLRVDRAAAGDRLSAVAVELVRSLQQSSASMATEMASAARAPALGDYLAAAPGRRAPLANAAMIPLLSMSAPFQTVAVELRDAGGQLVLSTAVDDPFRHDAGIAALMRLARDSNAVVLDGLRTVYDSTAYPMAVRVTVGGRMAGYVVNWRRVTSGPVRTANLTLLTGVGARILLGNVDDSTWTNLATRAEPPPIDVGKAMPVGVLEYSRAGRAVLAVARAVPATPWIVVVELPLETVTAGARASVRHMLWVDAVVLLIGLVGAWLLSRRLTARLGHLTKAAESVVAEAAVAAVEPEPEGPAGDEIRRLGVAFDAMGRRVAEALAARRSSEESYRDLFESVPLPVFLAALDTLRFLAVNAAALEYYGYTRAEFLTMSLRDIRPAEDVPRLEAEIRTLGSRPEPRGIWRHRKRDGTVTEVEIVSHQIDFRGRRAALVVVTDIVERQRAQQALRQSEERYRALIRESPYGIALSTPEGIMVEANPALVAMLGYGSAEELAGTPVTALYQNPAERDAIIYELETTGSCRRDALQWKRRDGRVITARFTARHVAPSRESAAYVEAIVEDVTERVRLEQQFHLAQRMEAVGRLAGGIAHDFNNLLTVILTTTELLLAPGTAEASHRAELEDVYRSAQRGADLTRQLLAFSRRQVLAILPLSAGTLIAEIESLLRRLIGEDVQLKVERAPGADIVRADPSQLEQVLLNLAVNARDAMPNGGHLTIETAPVDLHGDDPAAPEPMAPGAYVRITVSDTGEGMAPDVREHAFEPFFTTKGKDKGTGLGLATVYGVVKQLGGYVWVASELGRGTTFRIYLPRVDDAPRPQAPEPARRQDAASHETILLAEDEDAIRTLLTRVLASRGYTVIAERSGEEALRRAAEHPGPIQLLVTDVVMAGMTGPQLAARMADVHPETVPLFLSGYTDEGMLKFGVAAGRMAFLQKPFTHTVFLDKVREVLAGNRV